jgi:Flp pilus assembly protein TadD
LKAWYHLGLAYANLEEYQEAITHLWKVVEFNPEHYEAWNYLGIIYEELGKSREATMCFQKAEDLKKRSSVKS